MLESLENGKKEVLLKQAGLARGDLRKLVERVQRLLDMLTEGIVENQLIELLVEIEKVERSAKKK